MELNSLEEKADSLNVQIEKCKIETAEFRNEFREGGSIHLLLQEYSMGTLLFSLAFSLSSSRDILAKLEAYSLTSNNLEAQIRDLESAEWKK